MVGRRDRQPVGAPVDPYEAGPGDPGPHVHPRNGAGTAALVCGFIALLCAIGFFLVVTVPLGVLLGVVAVVLGVVGRSRFKRGMATNGGSALVGLVTGLIAVLILGGLLAAGATFLSKHKDDFKSYNDCARSAGTDKAKLQDCAKQFGNSLTN